MSLESARVCACIAGSHTAVCALCRVQYLKGAGITRMPIASITLGFLPLVSHICAQKESPPVEVMHATCYACYAYL